MFFVLSKILHFIFSPLSWIIAFFLAGIFFKKSVWKKRCINTGIILLLLFTNPVILNFSMHSWEVSSRKSSTIEQPYDVAVLLGGAMRYYNSEMDRVVYGSAVDRFFQCISLYRQGKIKKILISGGSGLLLDQKHREAELLKRVLLNMGIPDQDILIENNSRNTRENAIYSAEILKKEFDGKRILLVTSGYHMRRSLACFKKAGITVDTFSTDEHSGKGQYSLDKILLPDVSILEAWKILFHEWIGYFSYWIAGYV